MITSKAFGETAMTEQVVSRTARDRRAANVEAYEAMKKLAFGLIAELGTRKAASPAHFFVCSGFPCLI